MKNEVIYEKLDGIEKMLRFSVDKPMKIDETAEFTGIKKSTLYLMVSKKTILTQNHLENSNFFLDWI